MTVRRVLTWPHSALRETCKAVDDVKGEEVVQLIKDLRDTVKAYKAHGVAASQIGSYHRVIIVADGDIHRILINPEIIEQDGEEKGIEGCLSFPGVRASIKRSKTVTVVYLDEDGHPHKWSPEGLSAVAIQHELDHLDGVVMLDHMSLMDKKIALRRLKKIKKRLGAYAA
jgi:peptide deformylase